MHFQTNFSTQSVFPISGPSQLEATVLQDLDSYLWPPCWAEQLQTDVTGACKSQHASWSCFSLPPQGWGGAQVWIKRQLQQTTAFEAGLTGPGPPRRCRAMSCLREAVPVWKRMWDSQRGWLPPFLSLSTLSQPVLLRSHSLSPPLTTAQPRATASPCGSLKLPSEKGPRPSQAFHQLSLGAVHSSIWVSSVKEKAVSLQGVLALTDKLTNKWTKANKQLYRDMFCFFILLTPSKGNICVLHNLRYFAHTHTKNTDLSTKG